MKTTHRSELTGIDLSGNQYTVEQTGSDQNFRPEYEARDVTGETLFSGKYQMYEGKDKFQFIDSDGTEIFTVEAGGTWDIAGDYLLTDSQTGEEIVVLDNDVSLFQDTWRIRDPNNGSLFAEINSRGGAITLGRKILPVGQWIGHEYEISDSDGEPVGSIESGFAIFDEYEITFSDTSSVPVAPIVVGAIVIDGIQGN
jgi:uncharacterized protein YxjI